MQDPMHSTPSYAQAHELALKHGSTLFLIQDSKSPEAQAVLSQLEIIDQDQLLILEQCSEAREQLNPYLDKIAQHLEQVHVGWQAVVVGEEGFIWQMAQFLATHGLMKDEIQLVCTEGLRLVYCVHCASMQTHAVEDFCHCKQCGVYLLVRSHFSERLGAYMGVCADAECPKGDAA